VLVAVVSDGKAGTYSSRNMAALGGRTGVEDFGDVGVLHQRQGLAFGVEAATTALVSMPALISLSATVR